MPIDHVGPAREHRLEQPPELARVVLAVPVHLDGDVEVPLERVHVAGLDGAADPEVEGQAQDARSGLGGAGCRGVRGAVVDDDHLELRIEAAQLADDLCDRGLLVVRGHDRNAPRVLPVRVGHSERNRLGHATGIGRLEQFLDRRPVAGDERVDRSNG